MPLTPEDIEKLTVHVRGLDDPQQTRDRLAHYIEYELAPYQRSAANGEYLAMLDAEIARRKQISTLLP